MMWRGLQFTEEGDRLHIEKKRVVKGRGGKDFPWRQQEAQGSKDKQLRCDYEMDSVLIC